MNLKDHPDIECLPVKETHYLWEKHGNYKVLNRDQRFDSIKYNLSRIISHTESKDAGALMDWFSRYMSEPVDDNWFLNIYPNRNVKRVSADFSNLYSNLDECAWRQIRKITKELRVIYILRSPIRRLWSHTQFHARFTGEGEAMADWGTDEFSRFIFQNQIHRYGSYTETLSRMRRALSPEELKIIHYERIGSEPENVMREVEDFLKVKHFCYDRASLNIVHNGQEPRKPPEAFKAVATTIVEDEFSAMRRAQIPVPQRWLDDLEEMRTRSC